MRFLALSPALTLALIAAGLVLVTVAYLLKPGRRKVAVASLAVWSRVLNRHRPSIQRWRWWLSLLLAGLIVATLALALSRPEPAAFVAQSQRVVLMLDNSPSMAARARDGATRWQHAVAQAQTWVAGLGAASEVMVLDSMGQAPVAGFVPPSHASRTIASLPLMTTGTPRRRELPSPLPRAQVHWFTDGVSLPLAPDGVQVHNVFEPASNVGITAFAARARPGDATQVRAVVEVTNALHEIARVRLDVTGPGFQEIREVTVSAGGSALASFDVSRGEAGLYRASLQTSDAIAADDTGYAWVPRHAPITTLLVTPGSPRLEDSLRALAGIQLSVVAPSRYRPDVRHEVVVFDRYTPDGAPAQASIHFGASELFATRARPVRETAAVAWDSVHALTTGVAWSDLRIGRGRLRDGGVPTQAVLVSAAPLDGGPEGALIIAQEGSPRRVHLGFAVEDSNFALQAGFPVFLGNTLAWLTQQAVPQARELGEVSVPGVAGEVVDAQSGPVAAFHDASRTRFTARTPGLYTVTQQGRRVQVLVNGFDPARSRINDSVLPPQQLTPLLADHRRHVPRAEFWTLLLGGVALLLLVQWASFTRKATV